MDFIFTDVEFTFRHFEIIFNRKLMEKKNRTEINGSRCKMANNMRIGYFSVDSLLECKRYEWGTKRDFGVIPLKTRGFVKLFAQFPSQ